MRLFRCICPMQGGQELPPPRRTPQSPSISRSLPATALRRPAMTMPRTAAAAAVALALLLCAGSAAAQPAADCHSNFTAGIWWENMEPEVLKQVENITHAIAHHYDKLVQDTGVLDCPEEPVLEVSGCQQYVAGTNVRVWMNVTCPDTKGREVKVNFHLDLYEVIGDDDGDIDMQFIDIDIDHVWVDGKRVGADIEDIIEGNSKEDEKTKDALDAVEHELDEAFDNIAAATGDTEKPTIPIPGLDYEYKEEFETGLGR
ncbi:sporulation domain-containing [Chlorella sorokiniana]|uniref:Sporulation domain-containing n=1 Tax=Chlorella sorokiniana TaxID=3076 RepID=A0A2P6TKZ7_CHLSO|nr:sporulation domain-containing [Chlorella sorokiniana]|eukprot:PRW44945.1 sporulation domain-containing [Chlorella sorokiniana]